MHNRNDSAFAARRKLITSWAQIRPDLTAYCAQPTITRPVATSNPDNPADRGVPMPFGLDTLIRPHLVTWAVHPADIQAAAAASAAAGADLGDVWPLSRRTPTGTLLQWRLASVHPEPLDGVSPFVIDWGTTTHPAPALPRLGLRGLRASHPDPAAVAVVLDALDVQLSVGQRAPGLAALLDTPKGLVILT